MSPDSPRMEQEGMNEARLFFEARPGMSKQMVLFFGEQVFRRRQRTGNVLLHAQGDGFRRMAYLIAKSR